eukprot:scaffold39516_cov75-Phaeocystis_antarctica.AAC.2
MLRVVSAGVGAELLEQGALEGGEAIFEHCTGDTVHAGGHALEGVELAQRRREGPVLVAEGLRRALPFCFELGPSCDEACVRRQKAGIVQCLGCLPVCPCVPPMGLEAAPREL